MVTSSPDWRSSIFTSRSFTRNLQSLAATTVQLLPASSVMTTSLRSAVTLLIFPLASAAWAVIAHVNRNATARRVDGRQLAGRPVFQHGRRAQVSDVEAAVVTDVDGVAGGIGRQDCPQLPPRKLSREPAGPPSPLAGVPPRDPDRVAH